MDKKIIERHRYARNKLPDAWMWLFTNGTLLTLEKFKEIVQYVDKLLIDNYHKDLKLIRPCQEIVKYCEEHPELREKVKIVLRDPHEILTSRGGDAPNRKKLVSYEKVKCVLPYKEIVVRPDGKVSLCCNDALGRDTLGDLTKNTLLEIWNGPERKAVKEALYKGRGNWEHCKYCDFFGW